jgi:Tfp pilus assembly protein PilV
MSGITCEASDGRPRLRAHVVPGSAEAGFGMVELVVAMSLLMVISLAFSLVFSNTLVATGFQRERQTAQELANQTMEQIRALPFSTVSAGLNSGDSTLATDPNISIVGSTYTLTFNSINETIPVGSGGATVAPLKPHQTTTTLNGETYTIRAYVTNYLNDTTSSVYRAVVVVSWTVHFKQQGGLASSITTESLINASGGCVAASTHPFGSPCQPFLYSTASVANGSITVSGTVRGLSFDSARIVVANADSGIQVEQVSAINGQAQTSGTSISDGSTTSSSGGAAATSGADNDPGSTSPTYSSGSASQGAVSATALGSSANTVTVTPSAGDTASSVSAPSASATNTCQDFAGASVLTNLPCGSARATQSGTTSIATRLFSDGDNLGSATLASLAAPASPVKLLTMRATSSGAAYCVATSGDGCVDARTTRTLGTLSLGAFPGSLSTPTGWSGYLVRLSSYSDTVTAESGISAAAPSVAFGSTAPTISYWNGSGYSTLTMATGSAVIIPAATVDRTSTVDGRAVRIQMIPSLTTGGTSTTDSASSSGTATRTAASGNAASPIIGTIRFVVTSDADTVADLTLTIDLGASVANTSYTAAPSAG